MIWNDILIFVSETCHFSFCSDVMNDARDTIRSQKNKSRNIPKDNTKGNTKNMTAQESEDSVASANSHIQAELEHLVKSIIEAPGAMTGGQGGSGGEDVREIKEAGTKAGEAGRN